MTTWHERRVPVDGVCLRVREAGRGRPVLMLHGFTGRAESLEALGEALAVRRRVVCVDLIGHGESDAPDALACYAMGRCVGQLVGVLDALELERPHGLGYSMGARVALALCVAHPERLASAMLVGARAGLCDAEERRLRRQADEALARRLLHEGIEAFVDRWMALPLFASQQRLGAAALERARAQRLRASPLGLARSLEGMGLGAQPALHDRLGRVRLPVCLVVGAEDTAFRAAADDLAMRLPDARVRLVPEAGHAAHLENPAAFVSLALAFLDAVESEAGPKRRIDRALPSAGSGPQPVPPSGPWRESP
jgi:2-succinyl-6-hydroxy-2,4-cyclohexadiene-1-carboxylate synthase